jgi:hypothetical protein
LKSPAHRPTTWCGIFSPILNVRLERVEVVALQEDVFYGVLCWKWKAARCGWIPVPPMPWRWLPAFMPHFCGGDVMNTAAIVRRRISSRTRSPSAAVAEEEPEEHEGHLDVLRVF